jgi:hypothetical protein
MCMQTFVSLSEKKLCQVKESKKGYVWNKKHVAECPRQTFSPSCVASERMWDVMFTESRVIMPKHVSDRDTAEKLEKSRLPGSDDFT